MDPKILQFLAGTELFGTLSPEALQQVAPLFKPQRYFSNVPVFEQGGEPDQLFLIVSGAVEVRRKDTLTGMEFLLAVYGPGKSIGEEGVITDQPHPITAIAVEETVVLGVAKTDMWRAMSVFPDVGVGAARIMARRTNRFIAEKGVRFISLSKLSVEPDVVGAIPERLVREHQVIPVARKGKTLTVAMVNPHNLVAYDEVQRAAKGMYIEPVGVAESDFDRFMRLHMEKMGGGGATADEHVLPPMPPRQHQLRFHQEGNENINEAERRGEVQGEQVIQHMNQIIGDALVLDASDIHIEPSADKIHIRYRIDGKLLKRADGIPMRFHSALVNRMKALASMDITERRKPLDGRLGITFNSREVSLRLSTVPTRFGENLVMRVLDKSNALMSLDRIVLVPSVREMIRALIFQPHGIVLVTGPTGSGKTTTMYSSILERQGEGVNIVTVEDPVEYTIPGITQVQFNEGVGLTYAEAVRAFLRQDTDVMLIGETRDARTAHNAIQAALSGHLVVSSLHTNSALGTVYRLKEMGIEQFLIANALAGVVAQRLVRLVCTECREPFNHSPAVVQRIYENAADAPQMYRGAGCARCNNTGFRSRTAILEVMPMSEDLRTAIAEGASMAELRRVAADAGMVTFRDYAKYLLSRGLTTPSEVLRVLYIEEDLNAVQARLVDCPACHHKNPAGHSFCEECGADIRTM
ncbi:MAG: Flp pilus assembly complex ATPase component TadA [Myxococcales bacterium]|nr:Flp pilus assembly complex ATPase component TadA [Myxococcales bacterium]